jgi:hypothetical protein
MKEPQSLCQGQRNLYVHEIRTSSSCERDGRWEKKMGEEMKKVCCDHVREKEETKLVSEYYSSKLVSIFTHQNFLVKVVRLLGVAF